MVKKQGLLPDLPVKCLSIDLGNVILGVFSNFLVFIEVFYV